MQQVSTNNAMVDAIAQINFEGDITPRSWYKHICYKTAKGVLKVDRLAIDILADIVYWYRPFLKRHELTGDVLGWTKKFSDDVLRRSTEAFAEVLNTTPRCVRESMKVLENLGLIKVILRPLKTAYGVLPNVMYIEVVPEAIAEITYRHKHAQETKTLEKSLLQKWVTSPYETSNFPLRNEEIPLTKQVTSPYEISNSSIYIDFSETTSEEGVSNTESQDERQVNKSNNLLNKTNVTQQTDNSKSRSSPMPGRGATNQDELDNLSRRLNPVKGTYKSMSSDIWMESANNPDKGFSQWVFDRRYKDKPGTTLADAKAEIRNDYTRASDLWDEYLAERENQEARKANLAQQEQLTDSGCREPKTGNSGHIMTPEARAAFKARLLEKVGRVS